SASESVKPYTYASPNSPRSTNPSPRTTKDTVLGSGSGGTAVISSSSGGSITYGDWEAFRISAGWLGSVGPCCGILFASCCLTSPWQPGNAATKRPIIKMTGRQGDMSILAGISVRTLGIAPTRPGVGLSVHSAFARHDERRSGGQTTVLYSI